MFDASNQQKSFYLQNDYKLFNEWQVSGVPKSGESGVKSKGIDLPSHMALSVWSITSNLVNGCNRTE